MANPETKILNGFASDIEGEFLKVISPIIAEPGIKLPLMANYFLTKEFDNKKFKDGIDQYIYDLESDEGNDTNFEVVSFAKDILSGKTRTFGTSDFEYEQADFEPSEISGLREISSNWDSYNSKYQLFEESLKLARKYRNVITTLSPMFAYDNSDVNKLTEEFAKTLNNVGIDVNSLLIDQQLFQWMKMSTKDGKGTATRKKMTKSLEDQDLLGFYLRKARDMAEGELLVLPNNYKISKDEIEKFSSNFIKDSNSIVLAVASLQEVYSTLISSIRSFKSNIEVNVGNQLLQYTTHPDVRLMEIPYFEDSGAVLDNPPNIPNVNFNTYRNVQNRMGISLNAGQGLTPMAPITFSEEEERYYQLYRESRKLNDFQDIDFKSDEFENLPKTFEIRRLAVAPKSYDDFKDARIINTSTSYSGGKRASSTNYEDNIEPNRKYYYMFRANDRRGIRSNPTAVYEIEIVENSGAVYPLINSYDMIQQDKQTTKNLKRLQHRSKA